MFLDLTRVTFIFFLSIISHLPVIFSAIPQHMESMQCSDNPSDPAEYPEDPLEEKYGEVIFSSILFRHGARHRVFRYPTDTQVEFYEKKGWGLLTRTGKCQIFELGRWTRARYKKLLRVTPYDSEVINVLSTMSDRTISSAQLFIAGFYPPTTDLEKWNDVLDWQPIPVYATPKEMDKMLLFEKYCPRYNLEMILHVNNSPELKKLYEDNKKIFKTLEDEAKITLREGDIASAINELVHMRDNFIIDERFDRTLPPWAKEIYPDPMKELSLKFFEIQTYTKEMKRLKGGLLVKNMIDDMVRRRDFPNLKKRFQLYSGHDTTIAVLLRTLGVFDDQHPPYGAMVLVELRVKDYHEIVTVSYKKSATEDPIILPIPNCSELCTLKNFMVLTHDIIPQDWEAECLDLGPDYNTILF